jgi:hypothetical protein
MTNRQGDPMRDHYNFSKGTRGKFFRPGAIVRSPVYLDEAVQPTLSDIVEIDINPLYATPSGVMALDVLLVSQ